MALASRRATALVALLLIQVSCLAKPVEPSVVSSQTPSRVFASGTFTPADGIVIHDIPTRFTTPALAYETDGHALLWSSGAPGGPDSAAANLWAFTPAMGQPQEIFANSQRDSSLPVIRGDGHGDYAFVEQNQSASGLGTWNLWYSVRSGQSPELIDESDVEEGLLPFLALTGDRLVWSVLHETAQGVMSQLIELNFKSGERSVLQEADARGREFLYPTLSGSSLVFTTIDANESRTALASAVWLWDLADTSRVPQRLNPEASNAFLGVIGPDVVVWESPTRGSPFNGGGLILFDIRTGKAEPILVGSGTTTWHSIGSRFVVAESESLTELYVYDLATHSQRLVEKLPPGSPGQREAVDVRPRVAGDLLAFVRGSDSPTAELVLKWAELPHSP